MGRSDLNLLFAFSIDPAAENPAAGEYKCMGLAPFYDGEFEIAIKRGG